VNVHGRQETKMGTQRVIEFETTSDEGAARVLPRITGECVDGGYPRPETVGSVGSFGFEH